METCLPLALKDASRILKQSSSDTYIIESARRIQKLSAEDIIYVYKQQKYSVIAAKGGEIPVRKPLAQVLEELNTLTAGGTGSFLMVERGYIVNLFHVENWRTSRFTWTMALSFRSAGTALRKPVKL